MLILLDIDGVMVSAAPWKSPEILNDGFMGFSAKAVSNLQRIISETGASIVLTTSHKSKYTLPQWQAIFKKRGINASIDKIGDNDLHLNRKEEILNWLRNWNNGDGFVIIDDDKSLNALPSSIKEKFVLTSSLIGLNEETANSAITILKGTLLARA